MATIPALRKKIVSTVAAVAVIVAASLAGAHQLAPRQVGVQQPVAPLFGAGSYAGVDYPSLEHAFAARQGSVGAANDCQTLWHWAQACYTDAATNDSSGRSVQQITADDIKFIQAHQLGTFHRLWLSLDQVMSGFDATTGYVTGNAAPNYGFSATALANMDDALHQFANANIKLDLVLYTNSNANGFQPQALDGLHDTMMAGYIQAVSDIMTHIGADALDTKAVAVADLCNECYLQIERYFITGSGAGGSAPFPHLGVWQASNGNAAACLPTTFAYADGLSSNTSGPLFGTTSTGDVCSRVAAEAGYAGNGNVANPGDGCQNVGGTAVVSTCVDVNIIFPFEARLYQAAHAADPNVLYTVSTAAGGSGPMSTSVGSLTSQAFYIQEYPVDIFDLHLYAGTSNYGETASGTPVAFPTPGSTPIPYKDGPWTVIWDQRLKMAAGLFGLTGKRWFSGEAGCGVNGGVSDTPCTYAQTNAGTDAGLAVDQWWLNNAWQAGDQAVLLEQGTTTAWTYAGSPTGANLDNLSAYTLKPAGAVISYANGAGAHWRTGR